MSCPDHLPSLQWASLLMIGGALLLCGCMPSQGGYGPGYGYGGGYNSGGYGDGGGYGAGQRRYSREEVQREWIGATMGEVLDGWGQPYQRAYGWYDEGPDGTTLGYEPYMAYCQAVRDPYGDQPGEVEHIFFVLDDNFHRVIEIDFSNPEIWWGGDVEVDIWHEW